jgi:gliding motility-associated-like protein
MLLCLFALPVWSTVLPPPSLRCATVNVVGDVTLSWLAPPDPGNDFQQYRVYASAAQAGPYMLVGTVPVLFQTTFFHPAAGAHIGPRYYHVTTVSTSAPPNESIPSDTLVTMFLTVGQSNPLGSAVLLWNQPMVLPSSQEIGIWQEYPVGNWVQVGTVEPTATSYSHPASVCEDWLTFRVGLVDASGCFSFSSRDGDIFEDATPPSPPVITTITVDPDTELAEIQWEPPENDTGGYIIVLVTPGGGIIVDTIYGISNTTYQWSWSTPDLGPESFTVAAFDTCWTGDPPSPNTSATLPPHTTVHLTTGYDRCSSRVFLYWTPYVGWDVASYQILTQVDGGAFTTAANVAGDASFHQMDVQPGRNYCFAIRAVRSGGFGDSRSNAACLFSEYPAVPQFNYVRLVTVSGPSQITVVDSVDMSADASLYTLERSVSGGEWEPIDEAPGWSGPLITFVDNDVEPGRLSYRYRVQVQDSCGSEGITSNIGGNIILRASADLWNRNTLDWNAYEDWAGMPIMYTIHRQLDKLPFAEHDYAPPQPLSYVDDVSMDLEHTGRFCYYVQAVEAGNPSGINATSESNIACAIQEDLVYIPNAFVIGGVNNEFIPVIGYADVSQYELSIMNRWGQVIWTTHDRRTGWDGVVGSQIMPTGVYMYYCTFQTGEGRIVELRGHVTLLTAHGN